MLGLLTAWVLCLCVPAAASAAGPGHYVASRFDVKATVLTGGSLDVTETITFDFQSGTFRKVWREVPTSRTDGIEIVSARMDGVPMTRGDGPGQVTVSGRSRIRVEWQFPPTGPSSHLFELRYIARGVAYRDGGQDVLRWRLLPSEHRYRIAESRATITAPAGVAVQPALESRRVDQAAASVSAEAVEVVTSGIRPNGWVIAEARYAAGTLVATEPAWQQRGIASAAMAPRWAMGAAAMLVGGIVILLMVRQSYPSPGFDTSPTTATEPPEPLPAALAATLVAKGRASGFQSIATLLDLADRRVLLVRELPRRFGSRSYEISQVAGKHDLAAHEAEALTIAFAGAGDPVIISKARARLARASGRFSRAVNEDLAARGLLEPARKAVRDRLARLAIGMLLIAGAGAIAVAPLLPRFDGWPFLLPLGLAVAGVAGAIMAAATTPLSDAGLMQAARWGGFRRHLKEMANRRGDAGDHTVPSRWIVYGIALGLATPWSRYLKKHPAAAPPWFIGGADEDAGADFAVFVGSGAASTSAGSAGGGAAGGGGSGAG